MARLIALNIRQHPSVRAPLTLAFSPGTNILYGPPSVERRALLELLCGVCTGSFSGTDQPFDLQATFALPGGQTVVSMRRMEAGGLVVLVQDGESRTLTEPVLGASHLIHEGTDGLLSALSSSGGMGERWLPPALAHASRAADGDGPVEVNLRMIPELSGLWWHLGFEQGFLSLDAPGGALGIRMVQDGASRGMRSLGQEQRHLLSLFVYLACRPVPFIDAPLDHLSEEALDDVLRHLEPPIFGGVPRRQSFFCAHTSTLMYRMALKRPEDVQRAFVLCAPGEPWRKLSKAESKSYFQYFELGFRHIDDLMRLW